MRTYSSWLVLLTVLLWTCSALGEQPSPEKPPEAADQDEIRRVLLISSYHPGFPTFFKQIEGVRSVFAKADNVRLDVEFMDSKRFGEEAGRNFLLNALPAKLEQLPRYDAIMVADDNALSFVLDHQVQLFTDLPIVFFGINDYEKAVQLNSNLLVTGVIEAVSMAETIELMLQLRPKAREVVAIGDSTASGLADLKRFKSMKELFPELELRVLTLADYTFSEIGTELAKITDTSAVLLLSAYVDREGTRLTFEKSLQTILAHINQPIFHLWYHGIGEGVLGGKVINHVEQGRVAAEIVVDILEGEEIAGIPVVTESPNQVVIDHQVLKSFALDEGVLPAGTVYVNQPPSFYRDHKELIWLVVSFCVLQTVIILLLIYFIYRRNIAERELRESEERYHSLFSKNHSVMLLVDLDTVSFVDANPAACAFYGYSRDRMIGMKVSEINTLSDQRLKEIIKELDYHRQNKLVVKHRLASGEVRDVEVFTGPIPLRGREVLCSIVHDITDRKRLEKQLLQSQKMEVISTLAAGIAHDFNNILAAIVGYVELAKAEQSTGSVAEEYLHNVLSACERARDIIAQILDYGKKDNEVKTPTSMRQVLLESLSLLRATLPATVEIKTDIADNECVVNANVGKLHQLVLNLCTNASQAMEGSGGVMSVKLNRVDLKQGDLKDVHELVPGEYVQFSIKDTGAGIEPEIRSKIFESYFSTKIGRKGTGLGLSVVTGIVQDVQGYIEVDSVRGKGTCFDVYLPASTRVIPPAEEVGLEQATGDERILVVDDEPALVDIMQQKLTRMGYRVVATTSSEQAWELFKSNPLAFDLILTDQTMPELTGETLARRIKELRADIPVVISSGYSSRIDLDGDESYIDAILNKPVDDRELASMIRKLLDTQAA